MATLIDGDDLKERLERASITMTEMAKGSVVDRRRLSGKKQGVDLARSYLDEALRAAKSGQ